MTRTRVLIVDDSALVRRILSELLSSDPTIEVVGTASDAFVAREKIKELNPDVLTLDVEMPKMDGVTFLRNLMRLRPMPVVMVSSLTDHGADITLDALALGAVDYLPKPKLDVAATLAQYRDELIAKVKVAATARVRPLAEAPLDIDRSSSQPPPNAWRTTEQIIAIGASTGGTEAIKVVLMGMPADAPGTLVAQHIPQAFSSAFARRMNSCCALEVCEAEDGQQVLPGHVYIAPGNRHLLLARSGARYICRLDDGEPVNRHKPSVDALFRSVASQAGQNAVGVILTGMGKDGAAGLKELRAAGGRTLAQDEASSVVWGMPGAAVAIGAVEEIVALEAISRRLQLITESLITESLGSRRAARSG